MQQCLKCNNPFPFWPVLKAQIQHEAGFDCPLCGAEHMSIMFFQNPRNAALGMVAIIAAIAPMLKLDFSISPRRFLIGYPLFLGILFTLMLALATQWARYELRPPRQKFFDPDLLDKG